MTSETHTGTALHPEPPPSPPEVGALVERLRKVGEPGMWHAAIQSLTDQAGALIAAQQREIDGLKAENTAWVAGIQSKNDTIECLLAERDALKVERDNLQKAAFDMEFALTDELKFARAQLSAATVRAEAAEAELARFQAAAAEAAHPPVGLEVGPVP